MSKKTDPQELIDRHRRMQETSIAWGARQAIGDAVLLLLRDTREVSPDALRAQLQRMADGRVTEWRGLQASAEKGAVFMLDPPASLPEMTSGK